MKRTFLLSLFCLCFALNASSQDIALGSGKIREGRPITREFSRQIKDDRDFKLGGDRVAFSHNIETLTIRTVETITRTENSKITGLKIKFEQYANNRKETVDGVPYDHAAKDFLQGRTFLLSSSENGIKVTLDNGGAAPQKEKDYIQENYSDLGTTDSAIQYFCNKTISPSESLQLPAEFLRELIHAKGIHIAGSRVVLKGSRIRNGSPAALLDVGIRLTLATSNVNLKMDLTGEIWLDIGSGFPVYFQLSGPLDVTGYDQIENRLVMVTGKGNMTMSESIDY